MGEYKGKLHIEKTSSDRWYNYFSVDGLSIEDMNAVLNANKEGKDQQDVLVDVMNQYDNDSYYGQNIAECWRNGYGIYHIGHIGGHLLIEVGNSCD